MDLFGAGGDTGLEGRGEQAGELRALFTSVEGGGGFFVDFRGLVLVISKHQFCSKAKRRPKGGGGIQTRCGDGDCKDASGMGEWIRRVGRAKKNEWCVMGGR